MSRTDFDLTQIKALVFDIDGVLSRETISMSSEGEPMRTVNIKDGYAIQLAVKMGLTVAIITGATTESIRVRYEGLGVKHIYIGAKEKLNEFAHLLEVCQLDPKEIMYMGDDIPDYEVMKLVALPCAPADAAPEIKSIAHYISPRNGGEGCGRDIVEQVLKAQGKWMQSEAFGW